MLNIAPPLGAAPEGSALGRTRRQPMFMCAASPSSSWATPYATAAATIAGSASAARARARDSTACRTLPEAVDTLRALLFHRIRRV